MRLLVLIAITTICAACGGKTTPAPSAPAAGSASPASSCTSGELQTDDGCVKACTTDADCGEGGHCEQLHAMNEDGTIGPVIGDGCTK